MYSAKESSEEFEDIAIAPEHLEKKRACDGCRMRKRRCDGLLPHCSNCRKALVRDKDGNPICTYSQVVKKRGPKKGQRAVDTMTARVAMLESILEPMAKNGQLGAAATRTLNWANNVKKDHSDGLLHIPENHFEGSAPSLSISPIIKHISPGSLRPDVDFSKSLREVSVSEDEEEFELSLFRLGLQFSTVASNYRLSVVLGENHKHLKFIHQSLRLALCANGLFYSTHPYLVTLLQNESFSNTTNPLFALVSDYLDQALKSVPEIPNSEIELVDSIRALIVIVSGYFALGEIQACGVVRAKIDRLITKWHLFDPFIFNPMPIPMGITVDSLRVELGNGKDSFVPPVLSPEGIQERFSLWQECMAIDTFSSMISGESFDMDELEYPQVFQNPALSTKSNLNMDLSMKGADLTIHSAARNSIWGNPNHFALEFDDIKEMTAVSALHFSNALVQFRAAMLRIGRRAMRLAREKSKGAAHRYPEDTFEGLHNLIIKQLDSLPKTLMPFNSLKSFAITNLKWKSHLPFTHDFLIFLVALTYIHLPNCHSSALYSLSLADKSPSFSSINVLVTVLKALSGIICNMYKPEQSPRSAGALDPPAPGLSTMHSCVAMYMIASAAVVGAGSTENPHLKSEVFHEVSLVVIPALYRIAKILPLAKEYHDKLLALTSGK